MLQNNILGTREFYSKAIRVALPVMLEGLVQSMVSLVDSFMVAGLGDISMSAVSVATQVNMVLIVLIFNVLCPAAGIFMAQFNGAGDSAGMKAVFYFKLKICLLVTTLWVIAAVAMPQVVLALMLRGNTQADDILREAVLYQRVLSVAWLPAVVSVVIATSLREVGRVSPPLVISILATAVNALGNFILIYGHFGAPRLGVMGAAIATIIAHTVEMGLYIAYVIRYRPPFLPRLPKLQRVGTKSLQGVNTGTALSRRILSKGLMIAVSELSWILAETVSMAVYNSRGGAEVVSGMQAGFAVGNLFFICFGGIHTATAVLLGSTLGAGDMNKARSMKNWILSGATVMGAAFAIVCLGSVVIVPVVFASLSSEAIVIAQDLILVVAIYMVLWCFINAQYAVCRAGGDTMMGVIVDISANIMVLAIVFGLARWTTWAPVIIYAMMKLTDIYKIGFAFLWMKKERWLCNLVRT